MVFFSSSIFLIPPSIPYLLDKHQIRDLEGSFLNKSRFQHQLASVESEVLPNLPGAVCKPRDHDLLVIIWWSLRGHVDIMSVKQGLSLCQDCQRLHDDLLQKRTSYHWTVRGRKPMKNADSCVGCSLLVEGVTRIMKERSLRSIWEVRYHASRLSMRYLDTTLVFAGLEGSSSRRQTLSFL